MTKWVTKKLGDLGYSFSGLSGKTINDFGSGKPFIPYMNIFSNGKIDPNQLEYVHIEENEHQNKVEKGDWFFTTSSETPEEVGMTSVLVDDIGEAYLNSFCFGFRLYDKNEFDPEFASYLFRSKDLRKKISLFAQGSTRYNLPKQQMFEKLYITYPESLAEQRRIAGILSSADGAIAASEALIEKYRNIKRGLLATLLQPKEGWKKVKLGEVGEIVTGSTPTTTKTHYWDGVYNFYSPADFTNNVYCEKTERTVTEQGVSVGRRIPENSIMVACIASIGKIAINRKEGITNQQINTIIPFQGYDYQFLYYLLLYKGDSIKAKAPQTTIPIINKEDFSNLEFLIPDLTEQRRIAEILSSVDAKIAAEEKVVEKYKGVKKGLMEEMMNSGKQLKN